MSSSVEKLKIPSEIRVLIVAAFIIAIGFGIITPVLPQYAESFGVGAFGVSAVVSIFGLARLILAPLSGRATTKFGESGVYITGVTIVGISMFLVAFAQSYTQLLIFRGLGGFGSTLFTVSAMSFLAAKSPPAIRGRVSGAYASAFLIGNISGPLVGGLLVVLGPRAPFLIYGTALLIASFVVYLGIHRQKGGRRHKIVDERVEWTFREALQEHPYRAALSSFFANGWATFGVRNAIMPLFAASAFTGTGFILDGAQTAAVALSIFAAGNVLAVTFSSRLSDKHGRKPLIVLGLAVTAGMQECDACIVFYWHDLRHCICQLLRLLCFFDAPGCFLPGVDRWSVYSSLLTFFDHRFCGFDFLPGCDFTPCLWQSVSCWRLLYCMCFDIWGFRVVNSNASVILRFCEYTGAVLALVKVHFAGETQGD